MDSRDKLIRFVQLKNDLVLKLQGKKKNKVEYCCEKVWNKIKKWPIEECNTVYKKLKISYDTDDPTIYSDSHVGLSYNSCIWCLIQDRMGWDGCHNCEYAMTYNRCGTERNKEDHFHNLFILVGHKIKAKHYIDIINQIEAEANNELKRQADKICSIKKQTNTKASKRVSKKRKS